MLGAHVACSSWRGALVEQRLDERVHVVGALLGLRQQLREVAVLDRVDVEAALGAEQRGDGAGAVERLLLGLGEDVHDAGATAVRLGAAEAQHVDVLAGDRADHVGAGDEDPALGAEDTTSVSAGPYAAPPAAGPSTTEICGILPEAWVIAWKIRPTACSDSTPSASRAPPECQSPMIGTPVGHRPVVGVDDDLAADVAHRAAHHGGVGAERDDAACRRPCRRRRACRESSSGGDQLERALVEERREPVDRVARVLARGAAWRGLARRLRSRRGHGSRRDPEGDGDVGAAEAEGVVQRRDVAVGQRRAASVAMSSSTCGSRLSRLIVGGTSRWWSARTVAIDSSAPAPPSRWPVIDLVLVTTTSVGVRAERRVDHQALGDVALRASRWRAR